MTVRLMALVAIVMLAACSPAPSKPAGTPSPGVNRPRPVVALMRREFAELLIARGDTERARELLQQTLREAREGGMSQLISRVELRLKDL